MGRLVRLPLRLQRLNLPPDRLQRPAGEGGGDEEEDTGMSVVYQTRKPSGGCCRNSDQTVGRLVKWNVSVFLGRSGALRL